MTTTSALQFTDAFTDTAVKLFELEEPILNELLASGGRCANRRPR